MSLRFDTPSVIEDGAMANKPAHKKRAVKKPESAKVEPNEATAAKEAPAPNGGTVPSPNKDVVNAETAQVLLDADAGKKLQRSSEGSLWRCATTAPWIHDTKIMLFAAIGKVGVTVTWNQTGF
jgi:hypothetical protein